MFLVFCSFLVLAFASAFEPMSDGQDYIEPNFCRTQVLIGNLTLMHNGVKIYEYPMKWLQDNHRQKLKISIKGVADLMFTKFGRFVRRRDGDNFACQMTPGKYNDLCQMYYFVQLGPQGFGKQQTKSNAFHAHPMPIGIDILFPQVSLWKIFFSQGGDHFLGMVGEVSDRIQYIFSADQFHEGKTPDPEETILYEDCLMTRVDQEEAAESGAGSGAAAAWNKQHLKL